MVNQKQHQLGDGGAVLVWMALMIAVFLALAAFAVDLGMAYAVKRQLSSTADAASLAGAQEGALRWEATGGCPLATPTQSLIDTVNAAVAETHNDNAPWGSTGVPTPVINCNEKELTVAVEERSSLDTFFARIMGITTLSPVADATANVFGADIQGGLRPFTVCVDDARQADAEPGTNKTTRDTVYVNHNSAEPTTAPLGSGAWAGVNDTITMGSAHNLHPGDWVEVVDNSVGGANSGFYFVVTTSSSTTLTVSDSITSTGPGPTKDVSAATPLPIDLYKITEGLVGDGASAWAKNDDAITEPSHGLSEDQTVRVVVTQGAEPAISALYEVDTVGGNSFTLRNIDSGTVVDITNTGKVDVYEWDADATGPSSSACSATATAAAGNWGYARFDLGGDQPTLKCLVEYGYGAGDDCDDGSPTGIELGDDNPTTPEEWSDGNTGNSIQDTGNWTSILDSIVDETILLPVAEVWNQNGSNAQYAAKGGAAVVFCGYMIPKNNNAATPPKAINRGTTCWNESLYQTALTNWADDTSIYIQWQYVEEYVGNYVGQSDSAGDKCAIGEATCIPVVRLIG